VGLSFFAPAPTTARRPRAAALVTAAVRPGFSYAAAASAAAASEAASKSFGLALQRWAAPVGRGLPSERKGPAASGGRAASRLAEGAAYEERLRKMLL
jgi:hypothetical protein